MNPKVITVCPACKPTLDEQLALIADLDDQLMRRALHNEECEQDRNRYQKYHSDLTVVYQKQVSAIDALLRVIRFMVGAEASINQGRADLMVEVQRAKAAILDMCSLEESQLALRAKRDRGGL